ncbi:MAG: thioredoxin family protein [Burkholderiaceae bacterium]|jgi:thiol:disulfide interchange protein DsbD|nr:thioredoxin family protein [Burkholderiaceae bacterium]
MLSTLSRRFPGWLLAAFVSVAAGAWPASATAQFAAQPEVHTEQVRATLLAHAPQGVPVGLPPEAAGAQPVWVGLQIEHAPHWHTYWKNPGDSGLPTELQWTLPPGVLAGDIAWPLPKKLPIGPLMNYGYDGTVLLPVPLTITPAYQPSALTNALEVRLKASWLVCREECIPQQGEFAIQVPLRSSTALNGAAFDAALGARPVAVQGAHRIDLAQQGQRLTVRVAGLPASVRGQTLDLFPETAGIIAAAAHLARPGQPLDDKTWSQHWEDGDWLADVPVSPDRTDSPATLPLVLAAGAQGWRAEVPVRGDWPAVATASAVPTLAVAAQDSAPVPATVPAQAFLLALLGALVGGMVLNLMPCVFPILALKVVGFARHADDRRAHRTSGLAYSAGVVLSFLALGALMLALRTAGEAVGWGFQLQSPLVVAALAALFTAIGLNLAGVFDMGHVLPSAVATLQARHPVVNAGLSGVLAVAVASPCTAPFMGASLGLTLSLPAAQALTVFGVIGLGMALPYLVASGWPALARLLPQPGAWMDVLRKLLAFPMFGTVAWLLWVLGQQSGIDAVAALLALLVALALLLWTLGLPGRLRMALATVALALGAALLAWLGPLIPTEAAPPVATAADGARWQPWSAERMQAALAAGQPVFVDFTAAWCVTCQYNKKTTFADAEVLAALDAARVRTFRADWTRRDPAITAQLQQLHRSGVPVYLLQAPGKPPVLLSEILSVGEVKEALARL